MRASFGRNGLVVLDALRIIPPGLVLALGWVRTAASEPAPTLGLSLEGVPLSLVALSRHRLADGQQLDAQARAEGFVLVARLPQPATSGLPRLYLDVGGREFTLPDETIGPPLHDALMESGRGVAFDLLHHATQHPELAASPPTGRAGLAPSPAGSRRNPPCPAAASMFTASPGSTPWRRPRANAPWHWVFPVLSGHPRWPGQWPSSTAPRGGARSPSTARRSWRARPGSCSMRACPAPNSCPRRRSSCWSSFATPAVRPASARDRRCDPRRISWLRCTRRRCAPAAAT